MKSQAFNSSHFDDPYFETLISSSKGSFWEIFESINSPSCEFKSNSCQSLIYTLDLFEKMTNLCPEDRITIE